MWTRGSAGVRDGQVEMDLYWMARTRPDSPRHGQQSGRGPCSPGLLGEIVLRPDGQGLVAEPRENVVAAVEF